MPRDMNRASGGQSLSEMSVAKSTSDSTQEDSAGREESGGLGEQIRQQGSAGLNQIKGGARSLADRAREQVAGYADSQKGMITQQIDTIAQAIRQAGEELGAGQQTQASRLVDQAAGGLESLSQAIQDADIDDVLDSVRRFGRSNPTLFIGGAVLAGMALARFARASSRSHYQSQGGQWQGGGSWQGGQSWQGGAGSAGQYGRPDAQRQFQGGGGASPYGGSGSGAAGSFRTGGAASYGPSGSTGGGGLGTAAAAAGGLGSGGSGAGSSVGGARGAPSSAQGYAGGGMGTDPIQSSTGSGQTSAPSSSTDPSVRGSSTSGGMPSGAISTGEGS